MANAASMYDKYTVIQRLRKRGFSHEQAEGIAEVLTNSDGSLQKAKTVSQNSEQVSANVSIVAASSEEMLASIREISKSASGEWPLNSGGEPSDTQVRRRRRIGCSTTTPSMR